MTTFNSRDKTFIHKIKDKIYELSPDAEIYLYGSKARGDDHAESDWDLLILLNKEKVSRLDERPFRNNLFDVELDYDEIVSILVLSKSDWAERYAITPFYKNVMREKIQL